MTFDEIAVRAKTDKSSTGHNYSPAYERYLEPLRDKPLVLFELGIGGYQYPDRGGESLKLWYHYFPYAQIVGLDFYKKEGMGNERVKIVQGSQTDAELMARLVEEHGQPDIVIDDASHLCDHTIKSFEILFPLLKPGGLYFCEDIHTSFWLDYGGDPDPTAPHTTQKYFQGLVPQLMEDTLLAEHRTSLAGYLEFIHFYRNLVVLKKR